MNVLIQLFWSFFQIGLFSIGGGYAAMPLIQNQVVTLHHWLTMSQFADIVTIAEMTPGPIAINSATFVGTQVAGLPGALGPGGSGGPEYPHRAEYAPGGPYHQERLMRKERNPARPAVTRLCGIYYGIKQKER